MCAKLGVKDSFPLAKGSSSFASGPKVTITKALESLGLQHIASQRIGTISRGERARTLIASELIFGKETLFLDEPLGPLDMDAALAVMATLRDAADSGAAIILRSRGAFLLLILINCRREVDKGVFGPTQLPQAKRASRELYGEDRQGRWRRRRPGPKRD